MANEHTMGDVKQWAKKRGAGPVAEDEGEETPVDATGTEGAPPEEKEEEPANVAELLRSGIDDLKEWLEKLEEFDVSDEDKATKKAVKKILQDGDDLVEDMTDLAEEYEEDHKDDEEEDEGEEEDDEEGEDDGEEDEAA